jgi:hypothetical protein
MMQDGNLQITTDGAPCRLPSMAMGDMAALIRAIEGDVPAGAA